MTSEKKAFGKKLCLSPPGRNVNRDAFGTAISLSLGLIVFSYQNSADRELVISESARLQKDTGMSEQIPTGHLVLIRRQHAKHFNSIQQSPLCRRTVQYLK
jgi:hypothetical protein